VKGKIVFGFISDMKELLEKEYWLKWREKL